nr:MAG: hypothetical protein DIU68_13520 [Chloroflexota bacterium]
MFRGPDSTRLMAVPVVLILIALAGLLLLGMVACALSAQFQAAPLPTATDVPQAEVVVVPQEVVVTPTTSLEDLALTLTAAVPLPTQTPFVVTQPVVEAQAQPPNIDVPANCQVRTDWTAYTVQAGDTLGALAIATNTPLVDLVIGNCLQNPDLITTGQTLYLPRAPAALPPAALPPVAADSGNEGPGIGFVLVEPAVVDNAQYLIAPGNVTVRAQGVSNAIRVSFFMSPVGTEAAPVLIGIDNNLSDGAAVLWQVGATPFVANVWAVATSPVNVEATTNPILVANNG